MMPGQTVNSFLLRSLLKNGWRLLMMAVELRPGVVKLLYNIVSAHYSAATKAVTIEIPYLNVEV